MDIITGEVWLDLFYVIMGRLHQRQLKLTVD
jgi:hypothetical protein